MQIITKPPKHLPANRIGQTKVRAAMATAPSVGWTAAPPPRCDGTGRGQLAYYSNTRLAAFHSHCCQLGSQHRVTWGVFYNMQEFSYWFWLFESTFFVLTIYFLLDIYYYLVSDHKIEVMMEASKLFPDQLVVDWRMCIFGEPDSQFYGQ